MKKVAVLLVIVMASAFIFAGCGGTTIDTGNGKIKVDGNGGIVKIQGTDGQSELAVDTGGGVSLPKDYPEDVLPIYKGGKIVISSRSQASEDKGYTYSVSFTSKKDPKTVYEYYKDIMKDSEQLGGFASNGTYSISGKKDGNEISILIMSSEEDKNQPTMTILSVTAVK